MVSSHLLIFGHLWSVLYSNARKIVNKMAKLQHELAKGQVDIIVLNETHLDPSIKCADVFGSDYSVYKKKIEQ